MTIRDATHMAASDSATPRLEFTMSRPTRTGLIPFAFWIETQPGTADRLILRFRNAQGRIFSHRDIVQIAFYPIEIDGQLVYVMTLWEWDLQDDDRRQIHNVFWYSNLSDGRADNDPRFLWPVNLSSHNAQASRFSPTEVDRSVDENLWARLNWNALRVDGYVVASSNNANAMRSAAEVQDAADAAADDAVADISELLATATLTDSDNIAAWRCGICLQGTQDDPHLVSAHAAHVVQETPTNAITEEGSSTSATPAPTSLVLHAFHSRCLRSWRRRKNECPTCKRPLDARPLPAVWSAGNTRLNARMGVGMGMENKSLVANKYLIAKMH
jgi:hypothetical protein